MKTILKEGYQKIITLFYNDKYAQIHLREIARKTKLNENSAFRFLKELEDSQFLIARKDANLKKYELRKNDTVYSILAYLDTIKFNNLPNLRKNAIIYFLQHLKEKPIIAFLFGSTAKETYSEQSDIDLVLIVNKKINTKEAESYTDAQTAIRISCFQIIMGEFKEELKLKKDHVIQAAIDTGYPLTNHIEYYKMVLA
ncbi:MAG: nucleotidyltransferase domain-containing protein [Nanoarchaeota archaeon]|nr:nucleotidyltransferase domain-containing protein [Nanoarchaeota archaeon]